MEKLPKPLKNLIDQLRRLPGVGPKSAERLAFYFLKSPKEIAQDLGNAMLELREQLGVCSNCYNIADSDPCNICSDKSRDQSMICVVEDPLDMLAIEKTGFGGVYHILGGVTMPNEGIGPDELKIKELGQRLKKGRVKEIIIATNPTVEGETTALYLQRIFSPLGIKITRIARGIPMGGDLEYIDEVTLAQALEGRKEI